MSERGSFPDNNVNKQSKERVESLFYKISTCLQKTTTCLGLRAEKILVVSIYYTYFSILGVVFTVPLLCYYQKLHLFVVKIF